MRKRLLITIILLILAAAGLKTFLARQNSARSSPPVSEKEIAEQFARLAAPLEPAGRPASAAQPPLDLSRPVRLAIGGLGLANNDQNQQLGDLITAELTGAPGFNLVERQSLDAVLRELNLSLSGFVRANDAVRAGKLLKADWFLLGTDVKINGTNAIIARVVDAHTGILRDAGVFPCDKPPVQLAADLAAFMRQSRQNAATAKTRVYLAIGAFEDLSVNSRQADFPAQLRGYLMAAYQGGKVTLLEREYVETLLREVRLDLAGLAEEDTNPPPPMQSAFWLVSGQYQSYETTNFQVELNLSVQRIFGRPRHFTLRGLPGEALHRQIKTAVDEVLDQDSDGLILSRMSEAHAQMVIGKDLIKPYLNSPGDWALVYMNQDWNLDSQEITRQKRNLEEAMRAFETVILLEPTNRPAKMYLAACLRKEAIDRPDEARSYYREIIGESVEDQWSDLAKRALVESLSYSSPEEKLRWFESACSQTTNLVARDFYRKQADQAGEEVTISNGNGPDAQELAGKHLFAAMQSFKNAIQGKPGTDDASLGMRDYVKTLNLDAAAAAQKLAELLPKLEKQAPELSPYLQSAVLAYQVDTNAPVIAEFRRTLDDCIEHPDHVFEVAQFWQQVRWSVYDWCYEKTNYALAIQLMEGERRAAAGKHAVFNDQDELKLAYAYVAVERWQDALDIFEGFDNRPVEIDENGPWGRAFSAVLPENMASYCRQKLGLAAALNPLEFRMGMPLFCLCTPSTFITDETGLWIGIAGRLLHLDFDLKTNLVIHLPVDATVPITALCVNSSNVWIGTGGAGLVEFDKASHQCRSLTEADGLMMNYVSSLHLAGDSLWIGYGGPAGGGLGQLDLASQKVKSFMPGLNADAGSTSNPGATPPRQAVGNIVSGPGDSLLMLVGKFIRTFHPTSNSWETLPNADGEWWVSSFTADSERLVKGASIEQIEIKIETTPGLMSPTNQTTVTNRSVSRVELSELEADFQTNGSHQKIIWRGFGTADPKTSLRILSFRDGRWQSLEDADGIPYPPNTMTLCGNDLWVGGKGFIALVDLKDLKIRKYSHIQAAGVDRIQTGGGYVWAQFDWHLYRAPLEDSRPEFLQKNFAKFVPVQFQKNTNGEAVLQRLPVRENMFADQGNFFSGFKFTVPSWLDGDIRLMYLLAKTQSGKDFHVQYMVSSIMPENGSPTGSFDYIRESFENYPQLKKQFPYTEKLTTQNLALNYFEPGKTYGIWFEFDNANLPDIAFAMTVNSRRGTNEFGVLPLR